MTKAELIDKIASGTGLSKTDASRALDSTLNAVRSALKKGQKVTLVGFGTFSVVKRKSIQEPVMLLPFLPPRSRSLLPASRSKMQ